MVYVQRLFNPSQYRSNGLATLTKENFARVMIESINKAINSNETPVKEKHVRKLLIGSYQVESGDFFWEHLPVIRLKENKIVCWKFCLVIHKMLRDGHRLVLASFYERRQILLDCGNMWRHVEDSYGQLIHAYCTLLYNRINFLKRNRFPNDLKLSDEELNSIGERDLGVYFDLCCEIFDMLEDILSLQELILSTVDLKKYNSTTNSGQLHLAPLVACIQDSSLLYDYSVKILFSLHGGLGQQNLAGHRERFLLQHKALKEFYINTSNLQYFKTLIQIPHLPDRPPNFLIASDLQQHVTPKVVMISSLERDSPDQLSQIADDQLLVNLTEDLQVDDSESNTSMGTHQVSASNEGSIDAILNQNNSLEEHTSLLGLAFQEKIDEATKKAHELECTVKNLESTLETEAANHSTTKESLEKELSQSRKSYENKIEGLEAELKKLKDEVRDLKYKMNSSKNDFEKLQDECKRAQHDNEISQGAMKKLVKDLNDLKNENATLLQRPSAKATDNQAPIIELKKRVEELEAEIKERDLLHQELNREKDALLTAKNNLEKQLDIQKQDLLSTEMENTDKIIRAAAKRIEELSEKSNKLETGIKLEVNERILEVCTNLMNTLPNLIIQSSFLQREIVGASGKTNTADFYKRNSSWTDGLISAANIVAMASTTLVNTAELTLAGEEKLSTLAAAAHEVDTAVQQLIYASQVKVESDSQKQRLQTLIQAARQVSQCVVMVVDTTRICAALTKEEVTEKVDINNLNLYNTKRLEIETQGRLYELENQLTKEREKLFLLRRRHYELEDPQESTEKVKSTEVTKT